MRSAMTSLRSLLLVVVCSYETAALADEVTAPLFFDFPALQKTAADGLTPPADGTYEVWIWGKGPELAITIGEQKFQVESKARFAWHHLGQVKLEKEKRVAVSFPINEKPDDLTNLPGYLALSTDPSFDPKRMPLGGLRTLYDGSGFKPYAWKEDWLKRREALRRQILISAGLWPMPPKEDLKPQVYGKQVRDGYTIEKVVLETFPGFYLSGNLYRPASWVPVQADPPDVKARKEAWEKNRNAEKKPGILCPHGHWTHGRFEPEVQKRCKHLARMGAVVFSYDMVGRADSTPFGHAFLDPQIDLMGFSLFGLQTWDSIRALDFLTSLPDVDAERIACTGASGGGTQTFFLAAIDDRLKVAAPVVMVSQDMQGGCACENASGLRLDTDNSEIAALFAPKPQVFVCAHDWTWEFMTKGFPEVHATYKLFDAADRVEAEVFDFPHNYNQTSRERVYAFFAKWVFDIDPALTKELPLEPESPETISTWDADHPRPSDAVDPVALKKYLAGLVTEQAEQSRPTTKEAWASKREELANVLRQRLALYATGNVDKIGKRLEESEFTAFHTRIGIWDCRSRDRRDVPCVSCISEPAEVRAITVVVHPQGAAAVLAPDSAYRNLVKKLIAKGHRVDLVDIFLTGANMNPIIAFASKDIPHFSCYNRCVCSERVQDIFAVLDYWGKLHRIQTPSERTAVNLVGLDGAGSLCLLARTQTPFVSRTVIDANQFDYHADSELPSDQLFPGIVRLGGLRAVSCLAAPGHLFVHNTGDGLDTSWLEEAYRLQDAEANLTVVRGAATVEQIVAALQ